MGSGSGSHAPRPPCANNIDHRLAEAACRARFPRASAILTQFASMSGGCGSGGLLMVHASGASQMLIQADGNFFFFFWKLSVEQIFVRCRWWHEFSVIALWVVLLVKPGVAPMSRTGSFYLNAKL